MTLKVGNEGPSINRGPENKNIGGGSGGATSAIIESAKAILNRLSNPFNVILPSNTFNPEGAETFDIERLVSLDVGEENTIMEYTAKESQTIRFIKYGMFTNVVLGQNVRFYPTINGNRILKFHGDPMNDFALYLSVGPDLTENSMRNCDIVLSPGQTVRWVAKNLSGARADFGVRMRGYLINANTISRSFGG